MTDRPGRGGGVEYWVASILERLALLFLVLLGLAILLGGAFVLWIALGFRDLDRIEADAAAQARASAQEQNARLAGRILDAAAALPADAGAGDLTSAIGREQVQAGPGVGPRVVDLGISDGTAWVVLVATSSVEHRGFLGPKETSATGCTLVRAELGRREGAWQRVQCPPATLIDRATVRPANQPPATIGPSRTGTPGGATGTPAGTIGPD